MSVSVLKTVLLLSAVFNYSILVLWLALTVAAHDWFCRLNVRLFRISGEKFDAVDFAGIVAFKWLVIVLNLVPYLALALADQTRRCDDFCSAALVVTLRRLIGRTYIAVAGARSRHLRAP